MCNKCCTLLKRYNYVSCVSCKTNTQKYCTFVFHKNQYEFAESMVKDALGNEILACSTNKKEYICRDCDYKLIDKVICTTCSAKFSRNHTIVFKRTKNNTYDKMIQNVLMCSQSG